MKHNIMNEIKYSIIVPHYNDPTGLNRLLLSIPDREDLEVIIVDDQSINKPVDLRGFTQTKLSIIYNNQKKGAGTCRNIGIDSALGEWLLFADADDFFIDSAFSKIDEIVNEKYEVIFFKPTSLSLKSNVISERHIQFECLIDNYLKLQDNSILYKFYVPWSKVIKASFIKRNKIYFDEVLASNDVMFSLKVGLHLNSFIVSDKTIYCVTKGKNTLTTRFDFNVLHSRLLVEIERNKLVSDHDLNKYRNSLLFIILKYRKVIDFKTFIALINMFLSKQISFFPINLKEILSIKLKEAKAIKYEREMNLKGNLDV
ncbi:MAG: glycosyltransferase family 2 protein [Methanobacteriaceae archaeon]